MTSESKPAAPPSTVPVRLPPGLNTNVSSLLAAPERFSTATKPIPATVPDPGAVTVQVVSAAGPLRVSIPSPPLNMKPNGAAAALNPIVNTSLPDPPRTSTAAIEVPITNSVTTPSASLTSLTVLVPVSYPTVWLHTSPSIGAAVAVPVASSTCQSVPEPKRSTVIGPEGSVVSMTS